MHTGLLAKLLGLGAIIAGVYLAFEGAASLIVGAVNGFFFAGLLLLIIGLFRYTRRLHLYDLVLYSTKKFAAILKTKEHIPGEEPLGDYADYVKTAHYDRPFVPYLAAGCCYIVLSNLLLLFL